MIKKNGLWTIKSTNQRYMNPWLEVVEDEVIKPDGTDGVYAVVKIKEGISVLPIDDTGNVYLVHEFKYPLRRESIETVGAGIEAGEDPLQTAQRELKEELGIEAAEWIDMGVTHPITSFIDSPNYLFLARKLTFGENNLDSNEALRKLKLPLKQAVEMVMEGLITEQKSCCLILKSEKFLSN